MAAHTPQRSEHSGEAAALLDTPTGSSRQGTITAIPPAVGEPLAQLEEHLTFNQGVPGSSPGRLTNQTGHFHVVDR